MYRLEPNQEAYFLVEGSWIHESLTDIIYSMKEERNYGYQKVQR
jgi:hypothetical protein